MRGCLLVLLSTAHVSALLFPARPVLVRSRTLRMADDDKEEGMSDDALAAAFSARLEKEGGATQFKIKTTLSGAADGLKDGVSGIAGSTKNVAETGADGLLNASAWQLVVGLLAATVVFSVINAAGRGDNVDRYTSDGTALEFGQRSQQREMPYQNYAPELGSQ